MKSLRVLLPLVAIFSLANSQPASGISIWDVNDSDYGFTMKFSEQFVYGSSADEWITLPSAYWYLTLQLHWGEAGVGDTTVVWGDVHAQHRAVGTGLGPGLESNPQVPPFFQRPYVYAVGPDSPGPSALIFGSDGWVNSLGGRDVAGGAGTVSYDAQTGIVTVNGSVQSSRSPFPPGNGVRDTASTLWLATMTVGLMMISEKFFRRRQLVCRPAPHPPFHFTAAATNW